MSNTKHKKFELKAGDTVYNIEDKRKGVIMYFVDNMYFAAIRFGQKSFFIEPDYKYRNYVLSEKEYKFYLRNKKIKRLLID